MHKTWLFSLLSFWKSMTGENLLTIWQGANDKRQTARSEWCKNIKILTRLLMELPLLWRFVEILFFLNLHNPALCPIFYFTTLPHSSHLYQNYVRWTWTTFQSLIRLIRQTHLKPFSASLVSVTMILLKMSIRQLPRGCKINLSVILARRLPAFWTWENFGSFWPSLRNLVHTFDPVPATQARVTTDVPSADRQKQFLKLTLHQQLILSRKSCVAEKAA